MKRYLDIHGQWRPVPPGGIYDSKCGGCDMGTWTAEYHPWTACELFKATRDGHQVRRNLYAVVEFGQKMEETT